MPTLEEKIMAQIKGYCTLITTDAIHLEDKTRNPDLTVEDIEEQLGMISELIGFLNEDIERYRVKKAAQLRQTTRDWDNQLTISQVGCTAATEHPATSQQEIVIPASEEDFMSEVKGQCILIRTEAMHLEDKTPIPGHTVEDIEEQLGQISNLIRFLNDYIEQYRAQLRRVVLATDNQH